MTQPNAVLQSILSNFPAAELGSSEQQRVFEGVKSRLLGAPDAGEELKVLFKVTGFADFAMGLMWMIDRAEKSSGQIEFGPEDETLLLSAFRRAVGEVPDTPPAAAEGTAGGDIGEVDKTFATLVDQFSEAVQSGSGESKILLQDLVSECENVATRGGAEDIVELASLLAEFLKYITQSDLMDDVRVINIVSNVSSVVSQWSSTPASGRQGILEEALGSLRDFKSHFE